MLTVQKKKQSRNVFEEFRFSKRRLNKSIKKIVLWYKTVGMRKTSNFFSIERGIMLRRCTLIAFQSISRLGQRKVSTY